MIFHNSFPVQIIRTLRTAVIQGSHSLPIVLLVMLSCPCQVFAQNQGLLAEAQQADNTYFSFYKQGKYQEAIKWAKRMCELRERAYGPDHLQVANGLNNLGQLHILVGDYDAAEQILRRAFKITERQRGPDHPDIADRRMSLGRLAFAKTDYDEAERQYRQALEIFDRNPGANPAKIATVLNNIGTILRNQGKFVEAEPRLKRALSAQEQLYGADSIETAAARSNLAGVYLLLGNYAAAEPLYLKTLEIEEAALSPDHPTIAHTLSDLGLLYSEQDRFAESEASYQRALKILTKAFGPDHEQTSGVLNNLGSVLIHQEKYDAAEPLLRRALEIREKTLGADHHSTAVSRNNVAWLCMSQGHYDEAQPLYEEALNSHIKLFGESHPDTVRCYDNLATLYAAQGDSASAAQATDRGRRAIRSYLLDTLPDLPENEQNQFLAVRYQVEFRSALSLGLANAEDASIRELSAGWLLNGKAVVQEALATGKAAAHADPAAKSGNAEIQETGDAEFDSGNWVEPEDVRQALPPESAFIDIAKFSVHDFSASESPSTWKPAHYVAWVTHKSDEVPAIVDLGRAAEIDRLIIRVRESLQKTIQQISSSSEEAVANELRQDLQALSERIWQPLEPELKDARQIIISPDGDLWLVPWNALVTGQESDQKFLLESHTIRLAVSGRDLVRTPGHFVTQAPVILANPKFDQQLAEKRSSIQAVFRSLLPTVNSAIQEISAGLLRGNVPPLPNTAIEAAAIQPNLESYSGQKAQVYLDRYALEQVAKALHSPRILTFATHGFFLPAQEIRVDEGPPSGETRTVRLDQDGKAIENPLLRCGLLLAGCNNRDAVVADDDGILTGLEIVDIDLQGTELVVLSACETGIGDIRNGEGVAGLRQAFQLAGAQAVVSTLWQVPDRDSALLISRFFEELAAGKSKADALRNAQLERIEIRRERYGAAHPFFWAAFTLTGR